MAERNFTMRKSNSKETRMAVRAYLEETAEMPLEDIKKKFVTEMSDCIPYEGYYISAIAWLTGLGIPVAIYPDEIVKLMSVWLDDSTESQEAWMEERSDDLYWLLMAREIVN